MVFGPSKHTTPLQVLTLNLLGKHTVATQHASTHMARLTSSLQPACVHYPQQGFQLALQAPVVFAQQLTHASTAATSLTLVHTRCSLGGEDVSVVVAVAGGDLDVVGVCQRGGVEGSHTHCKRQQGKGKRGKAHSRATGLGCKRVAGPTPLSQLTGLYIYSYRLSHAC